MTELIKVTELQELRNADMRQRHENHISYLNNLIKENMHSTHVDVPSRLADTYITLLEKAGYCVNVFSRGGSEAEGDDGVTITRISWA